MLGLSGCRMINPAFDEGGADELGDAADTSSSDSAETSTTGSTTSTSTDSATSTDSGDQADSTDQAMELDLPVDPTCEYEFSSPFMPTYGKPIEFDGMICPPAIIKQVLKVTGAGPAPGLVMAQRCAFDGCGGCVGNSIPVGVPGLADFSSPLVTLVNDQQVACINIQTGPAHGVDANDQCIFDSIWVSGELGARLLASRAPSTLPPGGVTLLEGKPPPSTGGLGGKCTCEAAFDPGADFDCCDNSMSYPEVTSLQFLNVDVLPGFSEPVFIGTEFEFHVAQSQSIPCDDQINVQASWALVRGI